jgi:hypothetical protein
MLRLEMTGSTTAKWVVSVFFNGAFSLVHLIRPAATGKTKAH